MRIIGDGSIETILDTLIRHQFLQNAIAAGLLSGFAAGITGTYVVVRNISYIGGGISHALLGGLGVAYALGMNPIIGAIIFAILSAWIIGLVRIRLRQHEDTAISALWAFGMAIGIMCINITPGYRVDLISYLFGNILMVTGETLVILSALDVVIAVVVFIFFQPLMYICFDEEYSAVRGLPVSVVYLLLLTLVALTVVVLIQAVGIILVIALLTLPAASARIFSRSIGRMMLISVILSEMYILAGLVLSFVFNIPSGSSIIVAAVAGYVVTLTIKRLK